MVHRRTLPQSAGARTGRRPRPVARRGPAFEPALALYRSRGFAEGGPFADYAPSDFSQFLHLDL